MAAVRSMTGVRSMAEARVAHWGALRVLVSVVLVLIISSGVTSQARAKAGDEPYEPYEPRSPAASPSHKRVWPVAGDAGAARPLVTRGWEPPPSPWAAGHRGVDIAALQGRPVRAVADGRVSFSGQVAGRGVLSIELSGTGEPPLRTTYEPVRPSVRKGEKVRAGETVATVADGALHCRGGCLHWGAKRGERYVDPLSLLPDRLLGGGPSRLLPVFGIPVPGGRAASRSGTRAVPEPEPQGAMRSGRRAAPAAVARLEVAEASRSGAVDTSAVAGPAGAGGAVLALSLTGAALFARRRLGRTVRMTTTPPRAPP